MRIAGKRYDIIDRVVVNVREEPTSIGLVSIPCIVVDDETSLFRRLGRPSVVDPGVG